MRLKRIGFLPVLLLLVAVATVMGCTGTDPLNTGNVETNVEIEIVNNNTRFEIIRVTASVLAARSYPVGSPADLAVGGNEIDLVPLNSTVSTDTPSANIVPMSDGTYKITRFNIGSIRIEDSDPPAATPGITCEEFVPLYRPTTASQNEIRMREDQYGLTIVDIDGDAATAPTIRVTIDADAFVAAVQAAMTCTTSCTGGDPWCLTNAPLNLGTFGAQIPNLLTIQ